MSADTTMPKKVRWGILGTAKIAVKKVIPAMVRLDVVQGDDREGEMIEEALAGNAFVRPLGLCRFRCRSCWAYVQA